MLVQITHAKSWIHPCRLRCVLNSQMVSLPLVVILNIVYFISTIFGYYYLIRDFGKQNTGGNVSKISVSLACYRQIRSKSTNHSH